jgi:hypothetical protein
MQLDDLFQQWLFTPEKPPWKGGLAHGHASATIRSFLARLRLMGQGSPLGG